MKKALSLRLSSSLLKRLAELYPAKNQTETIESALEEAILQKEQFKQNMIAGYQSLSLLEANYVKDVSSHYAASTSDEDFSDYLKHFKDED